MKSVFRERPEAVELRRQLAGWRGTVRVWLPVVLGLMVIAVESTGTFSSDNTSGWIRPWVERLFGHINDTLWAWIHHLARKSGHFTGYGLLCLALLRAWLLTLAATSVRWWRLNSCGLAIGCTALVASLDEWHQTYLPNRTGLFSDVVLDTTGAAVLCCFMWLLFWSRRGEDAATGPESTGRVESVYR